MQRWRYRISRPGGAKRRRVRRRVVLRERFRIADHFGKQHGRGGGESGGGGERERLNQPKQTEAAGALYFFAGELAMQYKVAIHKSEDGYAASVLGLPGCWSQGATEEEALENIRIAISEYLSAIDEQLAGEDVHVVEIAA